MMSTSRLAPGVPADYYRRIYEFEERHFWYRGMRQITAALLGERLTASDGRMLDAGCGTGGFLRWALDVGSFSEVAGIDIGADAIDLARERAPEADLRIGSLRTLPFPDSRFDLVVTNDVLQHVMEEDVQPSLSELHRVLASQGTLLVHTNGSTRLRRERSDWRAYDRASLVHELETADFQCERVTYANMALSLWSTLRGKRPHAPSEDRDGIPTRDPSEPVKLIGGLLLAAEARWLAHPRRSLPYGHTLFALARKRLSRV
jgi:SAM-dependent methyltransferase